MSQQPYWGWVQASDGLWYPPEQLQDPSRPSPIGATPPTTWAPPGQQTWTSPPPFGPTTTPFPGPPTPPPRSNPWIIVTVVTVLLLVAGTVAFVIVDSSGTKTAAASSFSTSSDFTDSSSFTDSTSGSDSSASALAPAGVVPQGFVAFEDPNGEYSIAFPDTWTVASARGDISHIGEALMPDNRALASNIDKLAGGALPRNAVLLGFVRADLEQRRAFSTNVNLIPTAVDTGMSLSTLVRQSEQGLRNFGAEIHATDSITLANGPAERVSYTITAAGIDGYQYYILVNNRVWVITFSTQHLVELADEFDQIARTFVVN
jgi:hypothetical protein